MTGSSLKQTWRQHAASNLPRYTSYPTALSFAAVTDDRQARAWAATTGPADALSLYVHTPFCRRLCWYCGCHTTVTQDYDRIEAFVSVLRAEIDLWAEALGPHGGAAHLHFGGGSPNALAGEDFADLVSLLRTRFAVQAGSEVAVELDPGTLSPAFTDALAEAGVTRASLGVQTFDPAVQAKVNRIQPVELVAAAVGRLRRNGIGSVSFDLMYGLPGQTPVNVAASVAAALEFRPDRVAVFGYAHVPWMKKHQQMIRDGDLAGLEGRWAQAEAADEVLVGAGYNRIGLDHYALPDDALSRAALDGRLRRNFQGYTDDPAPVMVPLGPSSIGQFGAGFVQNFTGLDKWRDAVGSGFLPVARERELGHEDRLRSEVIERLMCDLGVDVGALCRAHGFDQGFLDENLSSTAALQADGLSRVIDRRVEIPPAARRLARVVAARFDGLLHAGGARHSMSV
ncbi:MAG: oxygen-independent coproporphyrinogen III oxidase [Caulobacteraceae bacterium]|nr:oxygen-independent coproporphyrinogen III oxidase [Caulobacteraceae bacterium]